MPKAAPVVAPAPTLMDPLKDALLFQGDFKWMFYFTLAGFCAANAMAILGTNPKINYFHGAATMVLVCFGGSTIAAVMCGNPVAFVTNEALVTVCLMTWTVMYALPGLVLGVIKDTAPGRVVLSCCYEIMRTHVMMNCSKMAAGTLGAVLGRPARVSVLIAGLLGGCGGGFMPLDKGLTPLANGTNWRIVSGAIGSAYLWATLVYPATKEAITGALPFMKEEAMVRCIVILFNVCVPLLSMLGIEFPFGANPLVPAKPPVSKDKKTK